MEFNGNQPIYLQIAENFCEQVLSGERKGGDRVLSVREWGAEAGVNPNTIARSFDFLSDKKVIFQKRGIGYFVSPDARQTILEEHRKRFINEEFPRLARKAELLGIDLKTLL